MIHYIYEGDIYISNMTQQLTIESKKAPQDVFYNLRKNNPSPFGGYLDFDHYQIVCASPERFLKLTDGCLLYTSYARKKIFRHNNKTDFYLSGLNQQS